ncbi:alpha/beta hydrolase [Paenibacillus tritici]|uniref:Alpha/beta hydrolase n=1 Tax=Paenibacillus tritici TaxID=1873425 RepID=A0ABX2DKH6_9BACL|nr:alpha/beta hydrolase [Paenibacillus tritici]NQX44159.1 alpha/beta hydrolase [Paenibacillus tritici]
MLYPSTTPIPQLQTIEAHLKSNNNYSGKSAQEIRAAAAESARQLPVLDGVKIEQIVTEPFCGEWVRAEGGFLQYSTWPLTPENKVILYFHGGGFVSGSCAIYRDFAARISAASGIAVLTAEYRLAPEFCYPAANEDCLAAYRWLLAQGVSAGNIVVSGDSVGATLALMTLITLRDQGEELPAGVCLLSPHADLIHLDGESYDSRAGIDPTGSREANQRMLEEYMGDYAGEWPALLSPLRLDFRGLPPLFIQAGDHEVLLSDAERLAEQARAAGNTAVLEIWENMWCGFQLLVALLPEAQQAIVNMGTFIKRRLLLDVSQE